MIEAVNLVKKFGPTVALGGINCKIERGSVYGLVGSNGAGKSTFLRVLSGVYSPDEGEMKLEGQPVFENIEMKEKIFFIPDNPYFIHQATLNEMARFYKLTYSRFSNERFEEVCRIFPIDRKARIMNMSKGMQRQAAVMLALSCRPDYLLMDEAFDGLDPVMRQVLKQLLIQEVTDKQLTVIIASHNLRELEDLCDHVGLLHMGGVVFEKELDSVKLGIHRIQAVFAEEPTPEQLSVLDILKTERKGTLFSFVVKGKIEEINEKIQALNPVFFEALPLTLEEVFIREMEVVGYDISSIIK